jgi:catechol 2,3-dioxygenase-like lactoylglutathione lyase family enzyme
VLTRLDHVQIAVRDLDAAARTYTALLGRRPAWLGLGEEGGAANATFRLGNTSLQLVTPRGEGPLGHLARRHLDAEGEGPLALAFETDDAEACAKALRERGVRVADPVAGEDREVSTGEVRRWRAVPIAARAARGIRLFAVENLEDPVARSEPLATPDSVVAGVDHVVVRSRDAEATLAVFGDVLGLRLALDRSFEERGVRLLFFRLAGVTVEVAASLDQAPEPDATDRLWGIAYQVSDLAAAQERLAKLGEFELSEVRAGHKPGTRVCTVRANTHGVATLLIGPDDLG